MFYNTDVLGSKLGSPVQEFPHQFVFFLGTGSFELVNAFLLELDLALVKAVASLAFAMAFLLCFLFMTV